MKYIQYDGVKYYLEADDRKWRWVSDDGMAILITSRRRTPKDNGYYSVGDPEHTVTTYGWAVFEDAEEEEHPEWNDHS